MNKDKTIINACLECLMQNEIQSLTAEIIENRNNWIEKNVPQHRV